MRRCLSLCLSAVLLIAFASFVRARVEQRLHLAPRFVKGEVLRYRIETRTSSDEHTVTPVMNPEGASQYKQSTSLVVRLDILDAETPTQSTSGEIRVRATFEEASSDSEANAFAPESASFDDAIGKLKGQSFKFSIGSGNKLAEVQGLSEIAPNRDVAARVLSWAHVLFAPVDLPATGIVIGQKWTSERPLDGMPLTGLTWRNESTYLRDEPCAASSGVNSAPVSGESGDCALLLTRFSIVRHGSSRADATPEDYLRNGLRTSGKWTGSGESLDAISLAGRFLVSATQTSTQEMDYEIRSASSNSRIHYAGSTTTQTEITLLPAGPKR